MRGDGGYLRGWSGLQLTSVIRLPCQGLSVSADWQLLAEKQNTVPVYAKYIHMYIQIHGVFIYIPGVSQNPYATKHPFANGLAAYI